MKRPQNISKSKLTIKELPEFRITKGEVLYGRYCSFCHGESGDGDGLNAYSIPVKPRNFNDQAFMALKSDVEFEKVILSGGGRPGAIEIHACIWQNLISTPNQTSGSLHSYKTGRQ